MIKAGRFAIKTLMVENLAPHRFQREILIRRFVDF
jgi:hypothetical protein